MAERSVRYETWKFAQLPLTNAVVAEKGKLACLDTATGLVTIGGTSTTLRPMGLFTENLTGDGTLTVRVELFTELWLYWWANDVATPVAAADIGSLCYVLDDVTVTGDATGASAAGRAWAINATNGVLVEMIGFSAAES